MNVVSTKVLIEDTIRLVSRVFEWFYISAKLCLTLSLGDCIKKKIQPIRICQITDKSVSLGNHKISVITRSA